MIGVELGVTSIEPRPIQIQAIETVDLLSRRAAMHLHQGLLVAVVPGDIKGGGRGARHLLNGGPGIAAARYVLQQRLVKRR